MQLNKRRTKTENRRNRVTVHRENPCSRLARVLLCGLLLCAAIFSSAAQGNVGDASTSRFVYLFGPTGTFVKLDTETGGMEAYWRLYRTQGSLAILPRCREGAAVDVGCNLIWGQLQVAKGSGLLYGVFPTKNSETQRQEAIEYQIAVFQLPELNVAASAPIPQAQPEPPGLLLTPDGTRLFLSFRDPKAEAQITEPSIVSVLEIYDADSLKRLSSKRETATIKDITTLKASLNTFFSGKAYFSADGNTIFDGLYTSIISGALLQRGYVNPLAKLTPQQRERLKDFEKIDPSSRRPWIDFASGDSGAGRTLVQVANSSSTQAAYWTVDLRSGEDSPIIVAPFGIAHLTQDGQLLLLQRAAVDKSSVSATPIKGDSNFWIYDVSTGNQIGHFENTVVAGPLSAMKLLCISPSGKRAFFAGGKTIRVVSLPDGRDVAEVEARSLETPMASCVFAGQ